MKLILHSKMRLKRKNPISMCIEVWIFNIYDKLNDLIIFIFFSEIESQRET